jgi:hypothetical protein
MVRLLLALALIGVVVGAAACTREDEPRTAAPPDGGSPSPTATASPSTGAAASTPRPTATVTATPPGGPVAVNGVPVQPLLLRDEIDVPPDLALIVETGCFQCDGPATGLARVYRDRTGAVRTDTLYHLGEGQREGTYITGVAVRPDGSDMVLAVCTRGRCVDLGRPTADAQTTLLRSRDGGMTWQELGRLDGAYLLRGIVTGGVLVGGPFTAEPSPPRFMVFPGGAAVPPPAQDPKAWPVVLYDGSILWRSGDGRRLLRPDGTEFLRIDMPGEVSLGDVQADATGERVIVTWFSEGRPYLGVAERTGRMVRVFAAGAGGFVQVGASLAPERAAGNVNVKVEQLRTRPDVSFFVELLPALLDLDMGRASPFTGPFLAPPLLNGRNRVHAVVRGPFVRVSGTGSCLNVRGAPSTAAPVLACLADGVLLRDAGEARGEGGVTWLRVVTPAGADGWASAEFLVR